MMQIHERIKLERIKSGLKPDALAAKIGVARTTYLHWEKSTPTPEKVMSVAKALGLPDNYFFNSNEIFDEVKNIDEKIDNKKIIPVSGNDIIDPYERIIEAKEETIAEKERTIKLIEAQAEKLERDKDRLFKALEEAQRTINDVLKPITGQITANSDQNRDQVLQMIQLLQEQTYIVSTQLEHQRTALGLGYPGQKPEQPAPFVKTGKGSSVPQREDANKGKGG